MNMNNCIISQNYLNDPETRTQVRILKSFHLNETSKENRKGVSSMVRFAGINLGELTHETIIAELKKIQMEKLVNLGYLVKHT